MTGKREHQETSLPLLANLPLSRIEEIDQVALKKSVLLLLERLRKEQAPINSFQARI